MRIHKSIPLLILALFCAAPIGCKKKDAAVTEEIAVHPWQGELIDILPTTYRGWIYVDIASMRDQPRIGALLDSFIQYAPDAFSIALLRGDEVLFGLPEDPNGETLSIVRSEYISPELRANIQRGMIQGSETPSESDTLAGHRVSRNEAGTQWMAAPAPNLLISGGKPAVTQTLQHLARAKAAPGKQAGAAVVFSLPFDIEPYPFLQPLLEQPAVREQARAIERVQGAIRVDKTLEFSAHFTMPKGGEPDSAAVLFAMFVEHSLPPLLSTWLNPELAGWFSRQFVIESNDDARSRGVIVRAALDAKAMDLVLTLIEELADE